MRKKDEGILEILAVAPWWVGVTVAALSFVFLKFILPAIDFENPFINAILHQPQIAWLSMVFLFPAAVSAVDSSRKRNLLDQQSGIDSIRILSWKEFEELLAEAYRRQGYSVQENHTPGADGGIDLLLQKNESSYIVQAKQWRAFKVGVQVVREMFGVMTAEHAQGVIIVTSGMFTQEAQNFAAGKPIDLVDGPQLQDLVRNVQLKQPVHANQPVQPNPQPSTIANSPRQCPKCGHNLILREARRGPTPGEKFWGCSNFPSCRYTEKY